MQACGHHDLNASNLNEPPQGSYFGLLSVASGGGGGVLSSGVVLFKGMAFWGRKSGRRGYYGYTGSDLVLDEDHEEVPHHKVRHEAPRQKGVGPPAGRGVGG